MIDAFNVSICIRIAYGPFLQIPSKILRKCDFGVHIIPDRFFCPRVDVMENLFGSSIFDWPNSYTLHLWHYMWRDHYERYPRLSHIDENTIKTWNSTFGQVARYVYYGSPSVVQ